jgi:hypothetical protein
VFLDAVKVDLARLLDRSFLIVLDAGASKARSVERTNFDPYTMKKGEYPVTELTWVRRLHIT